MSLPKRGYQHQRAEARIKIGPADKMVLEKQLTSVNTQPPVTLPLRFFYFWQAQLDFLDYMMHELLLHVKSTRQDLSRRGLCKQNTSYKLGADMALLASAVASVYDARVVRWPVMPGPLYRAWLHRLSCCLLLVCPG